MNTVYRVSQRLLPSLYPLSLLVQLISRHASGRLQVTRERESWLIYLEQGRLAYASSSAAPFDRLDRHLARLGLQSCGLTHAAQVQVRLLFDAHTGSSATNCADFQAIQWLVEQRYLSRAQATRLIEDLAKEVIETFLVITVGSYEMREKRSLDDFPSLCRLDLRPIVEQCHAKLRRHQLRQPALVAVPRLAGRQTAQLVHQPAAQLTNIRSRLPAETLRQGYTIACIDDNQSILQTINAFLSNTTFAVLLINDPIKALMQIVRSEPDLILLDINMPNLGGYELCTLFRRHPRFKQTPIVMVTGNTGFVDRVKAKLAGASGYLTKPFTQAELLKIVFKYLP